MTRHKSWQSLKSSQTGLFTLKLLTVIIDEKHQFLPFPVNAGTQVRDCCPLGQLVY